MQFTTLNALLNNCLKGFNNLDIQMYFKDTAAYIYSHLWPYSHFEYDDIYSWTYKTASNLGLL